MNKSILKLLSVAALIAAPLFTSAQKIAHVHLDSVLTMMPETKKAEQEAQNYLQQLEKTMADMQTKFQNDLKDYETNQASMSELIRKVKEDELRGQQERLQNFQGQAQADLQRKRDELLKPIYDKANAAIQKVAKANGYKFVMDNSNGTLLYFEQSDNILNLVKKEMNITADPKKDATGTGTKK